MRWTEFRSTRRASQEAAAAAAAALVDGDPAPARALLADWAFAAVADVADPVLDRLRACPPWPAPALHAALAPPPDALAPTHPDEQDLSERAHVRRLTRRRPAGPTPPDPLARLTWGLDALALLGRELHRKERRRWEEEARRLAPPPDPRDDAALARERDVRTAWRGWAAFTTATPAPDPAAAARRDHLCRTQEVRWRRVADKDVADIFDRFLQSLELAPDRRGLVLQELSKGLHDQMLGVGGATPGWHELAVRVLETGPEGPVRPLVDRLDEARLGRLCRCAVGFGSWEQSLEALLPQAALPPARADRLRRLAQASPGRVEAWMEAHGALRVLADWERPGRADGGDLDRAHRTLLQARGVARGRLRALVAELPGEELLAAMAELGPLAARTQVALRRYAWSWARQEQDRGFVFAGDRPVHPPCTRQDDGRVALPPETVRAVRAWVLVTVLKGHAEALWRWVRTGASDGSGGWGRALLAAPAAVRDEGARPYERLRLHLDRHLPELEEDLRALCVALALLPDAPGLKEAFVPLLAPWLDGEPPARGYPRFREEARRFLTRPLVDLDRETP